MKSIVPAEPVLQDTEKLDEITTPVVIVQLFVIVKFVPLSVPMAAGLVDTTRMRYKVPESVPVGIVILIEPVLLVEFKLPIVVGEVKFPRASDNSAV